MKSPFFMCVDCKHCETHDGKKVCVVDSVPKLIHTLTGMCGRYYCKDN